MPNKAHPDLKCPRKNLQLLLEDSFKFEDTTHLIFYTNPT